MRHNLRRVLHLTEARTFWVRAVRAWRDLLPDWTPTLDALRALDTRPHEHVAAVRIVAEGWEPNDPRWDVLMALLEWERRAATVAEQQRVEDEQDARISAWQEALLAEEAEMAESEASRQAAVADNRAPVCPPGECTWPDCACPEIEQPPVRAAIIPVKVVTSQGQTLSETTLETPIKAAFLDRLTPVKHLREKQSDA